MRERFITLSCALGALFLFGALFWRCLRVAAASRDAYGKLHAAGVTTMLLFQVFVNVGMNVGLMPVTGIPLPFISFGGSSLVISLAAVGVLLNISRYIREPEDPALSRSITINMRKKK